MIYFWFIPLIVLALVVVLIFYKSVFRSARPTDHEDDHSTKPEGPG
jgi:hypothetical protein